jgi:hypothetical protein
MKSVRILAIVVSIGFCLFTSSGHASARPFKAPAGTQVSSELGKDQAYWTITVRDGSAVAGVAKIKLQRQYWNSRSFQRFVNSYYKQDQFFATHVRKLKTSWKKSAYVISGTSGGLRIYIKGRLGKKGEWLFGYVVGEPRSRHTPALEKMVKALK